jgi:hypothetical protein
MRNPCSSNSDSLSCFSPNDCIRLAGTSGDRYGAGNDRPYATFLPRCSPDPNIRTTVRYTHVGYEQTRQTAEALSDALE